MYGLSKMAQPLAKQSLQVMAKRTNFVVNGPPQVRMPKWVKKTLALFILVRDSPIIVYNHHSVVTNKIIMSVDRLESVRVC